MLVVALAAPLLGADRRTRLPVIASSATIANPAPRLGGFVDPTVRFSLASSFRIASTRVRSHPACGLLFSEMGSDGFERLAATAYRLAASHADARVCRSGRDVVAFTRVGSTETVLCPAFGRLRPDDAAVVLLHEALHATGMSESPADPSALDSEGINQSVRLACGL